MATANSKGLNMHLPHDLPKQCVHCFPVVLDNLKGFHADFEPIRNKICQVVYLKTNLSLKQDETLYDPRALVDRRLSRTRFHSFFTSSVIKQYSNATIAPIKDSIARIMCLKFVLKK